METEESPGGWRSIFNPAAGAQAGAGAFGLRRSEAARIIAELVACTRTWRNTFDACGVSARDSDAIANAFRRAGDIGMGEVERQA